MLTQDKAGKSIKLEIKIEIMCESVEVGEYENEKENKSPLKLM